VRTTLAFVALCLALVAAGTAWAEGEGPRHQVTITSRDMQGIGVIGGVFFDESRKRMYVTDSTGGRILAFDSGFAFLSEFTSGGALKFPEAIVRDVAGRFLVAEPMSSRIAIVDMAAKSISSLDLTPLAGVNPVYPCALALDQDGGLLVADRANQRVLLFGPDLGHAGEVAVPGRGLCDLKEDPLKGQTKGKKKRKISLRLKGFEAVSVKTKNSR